MIRIPTLAYVILFCFSIIFAASAFILYYKSDVDISIHDEFIYRDSKPSLLLLLPKSHKDHGWSESHFNGFKGVLMQRNVVTEVHEFVKTEECLPQIDDFVSRGGNVVLAPSYYYINCVNEAAIKYPNIYFVSVVDKNVIPRSNVVSIGTEMYYLRYISGMIAGSVTKTGRIGYLIYKKTPETMQGVNAFTLGVKRIRPSATVVVFSMDKITQDLDKFLNKVYDEDHQLTVWTYHMSGNEVEQFAEKNHLKVINYHVKKDNDFVSASIASVTWDWSNVYQRLVRAVLDYGFNGGIMLFPLHTGIAKFSIKNDLPIEIKNKVSMELQCLSDEECDLFWGPLYDTRGI